MGTVYRARDAELDEIVALKLLRREVEFVDGESLGSRLAREGALARSSRSRAIAAPGCRPRTLQRSCTAMSSPTTC